MSISVPDECTLEAGYKVDDRWEVVKMLGEGAFGAVYEAKDAQKQLEGSMALKLESVNARIQLLKIEVAVLRGLQGTQHVCHMYACGKNTRFNFLLMSMLGPSLSMLRKKASKQMFSFCTTTRVTFNCAKAIRQVHESGWVHRDIKPSNFAIGPKDDTRNVVYIFDFGLCRKYQKSVTVTAANAGELRPARHTAGFRGTMRYASMNAHRKMELGRQDDLIGLMYMMVEMVKGELPWRALNETTEVYRCKLQTDRRLYDKLPKKLNAVHQYLHTLRYETDPNYTMLEEILLEIIYTMGFHLEKLDWEKLDTTHAKALDEVGQSPVNKTSSSKPSGDMLAKLDHVIDPEDHVEELPQSNYVPL